MANVPAIAIDPSPTADPPLDPQEEARIIRGHLRSRSTPSSRAKARTEGLACTLPPTLTAEGAAAEAIGIDAGALAAGPPSASGAGEGAAWAAAGAGAGAGAAVELAAAVPPR